MNRIKKFIARHFSSFTYFYHYIGYRIFVAIILSIAVGVLDGFGLAMFLPLLQMAGDASEASGKGMGKLAFLVDFLEVSGWGVGMMSVLALMIIFFTLKGIAIFFQRWYQVIVQEYFIRQIRVSQVHGLNSMGYRHFVMTDIGRIQNTLTGEVDRVAQAYKSYFAALQQFIMVLVYMGFAFTVDPQFALLVSVGGGLTNFIYKSIYKNTKGASAKLTGQTNIFQGLIIQHVGNYKYLKATAYVKRYESKLMDAINRIELSNKKIGSLQAFLQASREPLIISVVALVIYLQTSVFGSPLGPILISLLFFYRALSNLMLMQNTWNHFLGLSGSLENMTSFGKMLESFRQEDGSKEMAGFSSYLELDQVSFAYQKNEPILKNISLRISKNESWAFVGESGSGKTTLVNIIAGLLPPDKGHYSIDGIDSKDLKIRSFQKNIGYITQDPVIFNDTIFNNVSFWSDPTPENLRRFKDAIRKASLESFLETLDLGQETMLGANGVNLSGGQKQRISIARELFKNIDVLILDEATSALDSETEQAIRESIDRLKGSYTILTIAHRLSTIRSADKIVHLKKGYVREVGNFQELISRSPEFCRMVELQEI